MKDREIDARRKEEQLSMRNSQLEKELSQLNMVRDTLKARENSIQDLKERISELEKENCDLRVMINPNLEADHKAKVEGYETHVASL